MSDGLEIKSLRRPETGRLPSRPLDRRPGDAMQHSPRAISPMFSPLYQQIKGLILQALSAGEWRPGDLIPSENVLAQRFSVSQGTVRKAVDALASENILIRRQGKGTFVASHQETKAQVRFLRLTPDEGEAQLLRSTIIDCRRVRATADIARQLELKLGDPVILISRTLSTRETPLVFDDIWLPGQVFRGLTAERLAEYNGPLYSLFETEFGTKMLRADERIRAVAATPEAAEALHVPEGSPLLSVERTSFTYDDRPVEVRRGLYLTASHHYHNHLS